LHNTTPARYTSNQHGTPYLNSHYVNANYQQPLSNQSQAKAPQSIIFPELNGLTNEELKRLNEDNDRLDEFLEKHSQIKDINAAIEDAMDWVEKTAGKIIIIIILLLRYMTNFILRPLFSFKVCFFRLIFFK